MGLLSQWRRMFALLYPSDSAAIASFSYPAGQALGETNLECNSFVQSLVF